jgi:hypothetical protein
MLLLAMLSPCAPAVSARAGVTKVKPSPSLTRDLIVLCMTVGLGVVLDQKQVAAASAAIVADPSVEEMVQKLEEQCEHQQQRYLRQNVPAAAC